MRYVSLDLETGGLSRENTQILEVAAILKDSEKVEQYHECPRLRMLIRPAGPGGTYLVEPLAAAWHCELFKEIAETQVVAMVPEEQINKFIMAWCLKNGLKDNITFAGKNFATFDLDFLLSRGGDCPLKYHRRVLDPANMYARVSDSVLPNTDECIKRAGLQAGPPHMGLSDAWDVIRLIQNHWCGSAVVQPPCIERSEWIRGSWDGFRIHI